MTERDRTKIFIGTLLTVFLFQFCVLLWVFRFPPEETVVLYHNRHDGWELWVKREGSCIWAEVGYELTLEGVLAYVEANERLASEVFAEPKRWVPVEVTFDRPLGIEAFRLLVAKADMKVDRYQLRGFDSDGWRVTLEGKPSGGILVPENMLQEFADRAARRGHPYELAGVYLVVGKINRAGYEVLSAADEVFLIDVTKLVTQKEIAREMNLTIPAEEIGVLSPYGILEDLGLTNASEDG
jgi:hypothetical protein